MARISYAVAEGRLNSAQKPADGVPAYLRWVNRKLGGRVAVLAASLGWSPNGLTALSALFGLGGILLIALTNEPWTGPSAAVLLLVGYVFDSGDGQLARIQRRGGPAGEWLDHTVDGVRAPLVHIAIAVHVVNFGLPLWWALIAGLFSVLVSAWFLSQILAEKLLPKVRDQVGPGNSGSDQLRSASPSGVLESLVKQPQDPSTTYFVIALLGLPQVFVVLYTALFAWHVAIFVASLRRKYRQLAQL